MSTMLGFSGFEQEIKSLSKKLFASEQQMLKFNEIKDKIKKTYKNRYFILVSK